MRESLDSHNANKLHTSPEITVITDGNKLNMNWSNTCLRTFSQGDGMYDHVYHKMPDGNKITFPASTYEPMFNSLYKDGFPVARSAVVDKTTIEMYGRILAGEIKAALKSQT